MFHRNRRRAGPRRRVRRDRRRRAHPRPRGAGRRARARGLGGGQRRLPDRGRRRGWRLRGRRHEPDAGADHARRPLERRPGQPRACRCGPATALEVTWSRVTSTGPAPSSPSRPTASRAGCGSSFPGSCCPTWSSAGRSRSRASASPSRGSTTPVVEVSLIPETLERTTLGDREPGDRVNVECDVMARYVQRMLSRRVTLEERDHGRGPGDARATRRRRRSPRSRRRSRRSAAGGWSSSATTRTARTRAT